MFQIPGVIPPEEEEIDEMDDIDKVRDDLQSTKQLLAIELRYYLWHNKLLKLYLTWFQARLWKTNYI